MAEFSLLESSEGSRNVPWAAHLPGLEDLVSLIGAHAGAPREEVRALKVKDVKKKAGAWYIDLFAVQMADSDRYVPIHQVLLDIRLVEDLIAGRIGQEYLFPDLKPSAIHEKRGDPFTKWFTPYRRKFKLCDPKIVFHSFRHSVSTLLSNVPVHEPWIEEITSHESEQRRSELRRYNTGILLQNLKKSIDQLDYGLDLSHLKKKASPQA